MGNHFREVFLRYFEILQPVRAFGQAFKEYMAKLGVDSSKQNRALRAFCAQDRFCRSIDCFKVQWICLLSFWLTCLLCLFDACLDNEQRESRLNLVVELL